MKLTRISVLTIVLAGVAMPAHGMMRRALGAIAKQAQFGVTRLQTPTLNTFNRSFGAQSAVKPALNLQKAAALILGGSAASAVALCHDHGGCEDLNFSCNKPTIVDSALTLSLENIYELASRSQVTKRDIKQISEIIQKRDVSAIKDSKLSLLQAISRLKHWERISNRARHDVGTKLCEQWLEKLSPEEKYNLYIKKWHPYKPEIGNIGQRLVYCTSDFNDYRAEMETARHEIAQRYQNAVAERSKSFCTACDLNGDIWKLPQQ
jgi:hypothetical protein